jgi:hypothetical protein
MTRTKTQLVLSSRDGRAATFPTVFNHIVEEKWTETLFNFPVFLVVGPHVLQTSLVERKIGLSEAV